MRNLFALLLIVLIVACKKKDTTPEPEPGPVVPSCQTGKIMFQGTFQMVQNTSKSIEIIFLRNNCPAENANTYVVKGLGQAVNSVSTAPSNTIAIQDYTITSQENMKYATTYDKKFTFDVNESMDKIIFHSTASGNLNFNKQ